MKTTQLTKGILCAWLLMGGITLTAQTPDSGRGWGRARMAQPSQQNPIPKAAAIRADQGKPWPPMSIMGSWHVTGTFMDTPFEALLTFMPSDQNDQGSVIFTSNQDQGPPFSGTAGTGNWTRVGPYSFIATHLTFLFDVPDSVPFGILKIVDAITLNGDQITVKSHLVFPDPDKCGCATFDMETTGSRVAIEAPPGN